MNTQPPRPHLAAVRATTPARTDDPAATIDSIRRLHTPVAVCRGCCSLQCRGTCHWADEYGGELMTVCSHCCVDHFEGKQNYVCLDAHQHGEECGGGAICATIAILDGGRSPDEEPVTATPRVATRVTLAPVTESPTGTGTTGYDDPRPGPPAGNPPPAVPR